MTYLVVPVLVVEGVGPIEAVKRSASLLRRTWGEQIAGGAGMGLIFFLFFVLVTVLAGVFAYIVLALLNAALGGIYAAAVYRYAAEGEVSGAFALELIRNAFRYQ